MKGIKCGLLALFSIFVGFSSFAQDQRVTNSNNSSGSANMGNGNYMKTAPGCVSTLAPYYSGRAHEIPSNACDLQKESIIKSQQEYKNEQKSKKNKKI